MVCGSSPVSSDGLELLVSRADSCLGGLRWGRMTRVTLERSRSKWLAPIVGHHRRGTSENNDDDAGDEDYYYEDDDDDDDLTTFVFQVVRYKYVAQEADYPQNL